MHSLARDCNGYLRDVLRKVRVQRSRSPWICHPGRAQKMEQIPHRFPMDFPLGKKVKSS